MAALGRRVLGRREEYGEKMQKWGTGKRGAPEQRGEREGCEVHVAGPRMLPEGDDLSLSPLYLLFFKNIIYSVYVNCDVVLSNLLGGRNMACDFQYK